MDDSPHTNIIMQLPLSIIMTIKYTLVFIGFLTCFSAALFQLLTIAVLVILITAPLGAVAIARSAPHLLQRAAVTSFDEEETRSDDLDDPDDPGENQREKEAEQDSTADVEIQSNGGRK